MQARQTQYQRDQKREGEVTIEKDRARQSRNHSSEGEYVDFEEID